MPMPVALSRFGQVAWTFALVWHLASLPAPPLMAAQSSERSSQSSDRIWGLVHTTDGERHEGFLRFERTQRAASWTDVLVGRREIPDANYHAWLQAVHDGEVALRTVELKGYRISWEERHRDFAIEEWSQVRVGQLAAIDVHDDGRVTLTPRGPAGPVVWKVPTGARFMRVVIEVPGGGDDLALGSDELDRIEFGGPPDGVVAGSRRVQGTLEDRFGREFTGVVSWNRSPVFGSHHVHGRDDEGDDWRIPFTEISVLERRLGGALITTVDGERVDLYRGLASRRQPSDVRWYRRAIRIADPGIGTVTVAWDDLRTLRVHAESNAARYEGFSVGGALYGVVTVRSGEQVEGWLRWDADEEWAWEHFNGESDNVALHVEFGRIARIGRSEDGIARVTLADGRVFDVSDSNDAGSSDDGERNRGIFVFPSAGPAQRESDEGADAGWRHVSWEDLVDVRFMPAPRGSGS